MTTPDRPDDAAADPSLNTAAHDEEAEDRAAILRRRAVFIASAIAGLGVAGCSGDPRPCLDVYVPPDSPDAGADASTDADAEPVPCLSVALSAAPGPTEVPEDLDAGAPGPGATSTQDGGPRPRPCLKVAPRPCLSPPRPCLDMAAPSDPDDP